MRGAAFVKYKLDAPAGLLLYHQSDPHSYSHIGTLMNIYQKNLQPTCGVHLFVSTHLERDPRSCLEQRKRCKIMDSYFSKQISESFCSDSCKISKEIVQWQKFFSVAWDLYLILQMLKFAFSTEFRNPQFLCVSLIVAMAHF